ncbi:MAG: hypothetical protein ABSF38_06815 [Verrucomicrobiota bacterium]
MKTIILLCCAALGAWQPLAAAPGAVDAATRNAHWREDLQYFATVLPAKQMDFFKLIPREKFEKEMAELEGHVPQLSDLEIILELKRLVAGLGVAHTMVVAGGRGEPIYPVRTQWFSDGLGVVYTAPEYRQALGARVVRIGSRTPEEVQAALAPYISHENEAMLRHESPTFMMWADLMQHEKIADPDGGLRLTLAKADGRQFTLDVAPENGDGRASTNWVSANAELSIPPSFYLEHLKPYYGYEYLPERHALYIQYNQCAEDPKESFAAFTKELFDFADGHPVERVIVDLRFNGGGNSSIVQPLVEGLKSRPALQAGGHLYVLIGSSTFSSGLMAAIDLQQGLHAILVGRPTGGKPNCYGETKVLELPNSKLPVQYSTKHFRLLPRSDPPSLEPDLPVALTLGDFLAGRDPILEAALHH